MQLVRWELFDRYEADNLVCWSILSALGHMPNGLVRLDLIRSVAGTFSQGIDDAVSEVREKVNET